jgi:HlyD family type I secretion membrane fusion protein
MSDPREFLTIAGEWGMAELTRAADGWQVLHAVVRGYLTSAGLELSDTTITLALGGSVVLALAVIARVLRAKRATRNKGPAETLAAAIRGPKRLGYLAVGIFTIVFGGWSVFAPLASAVIAPGVISPDGHRKTIQHLEGGIIRSIHVREGETVTAGQPLITLDDTRARALDAEVRERLLHVVAAEARLEAEQTNAAEIGFPEILLRETSKELQQIVEGQRQLLSTRRATHLGRTQVLKARIRQVDEQNAGLREVIAAEDQQLALIDEEIVASQQLLEKGLERKPRVLALKRERADIAATQAANRARIAENKQAIGETRLQLLTINEERQEKISSELADARRITAELRAQLPSREDILERTVIRAPVAGTVMSVRATTESGVVGPGDPLLDIVPDDSQLIIDARVSPTDIERVRPGTSARVVLTAYRQRNLPLIHGRLRSISADAITDDRTGTSFFLAKVEVLTEDIARLEGIELIPGMPAEVMVLDGERSLFEYLLSPVLNSGRRSLLEN